MATDWEIRHMHVVEGWSKRDIADMLGHSYDSVRGRVSRASLHDRVAIAKELATNQPTTNTAREKQADILRRSDQTFYETQENLRSTGGIHYGIFLSDIHFPYANWDALYLAALIVEAVQPAYISTFNDLFDFTGYGRWGDHRSPAERLWDSDIANALNLAREWHELLHKAAPNARLLQVQGNHDNWMYHFIRTTAFSGFAEHDILHFMEAMEAQGVVQFTNGDNKQENIVQLSPGLKWLHGASATRSNAGVEAANQRVAAGRDEEDGIFYKTVGGHTHRPFAGKRHTNSGMLCTENPHYLKHRPDWELAFVVSRFDPNSRYAENDLVRYHKRKGHLIARYDGVEYDTPLSE